MSPDAVVIRRAVSGEEAMLSILGSATFLESYAGFVAARDILLAAEEWHAPAFYRTWLARDDVVILVAETVSGGSAIGYLALLLEEGVGVSPTHWLIKRIYLLHRFHGTGLGKRLMSAAIEHARRRGATRLGLDVAEFNAQAIGFYTALGFRIAHTGTIDTPTESYPIHTLTLDLA